MVEKRTSRVWAVSLFLVMASIPSGCRATGASAPTVTAILAPTGAAGPTTAAPTPTEGPEMLAARVNGEPIPLADYERRVREFSGVYANHHWTTEEGQQLAVQIQRQALESLIQTLLVQQEAAQRGLTISNEELESNVRESIEKGGGEEAFQEWLRENGVTREQFVTEVQMGLLTSRLVEELTAGLERRGEQVHVRHILLADLITAQQVRRMLEAGEDFAILAAQYSHHQVTGDKGGDLGWLSQGLFAWPEMEEVAFALQAGQISEVFQTSMGYHIIQVVERDADRALSPDMYQALKEQTVTHWLEERRRSAQVEIFIDIGRP